MKLRSDLYIALYFTDKPVKIYDERQNSYKCPFIYKSRQLV
jgi:hypothetical protein